MGGHTTSVEQVDPRLLAVAALLDEATGYSVPYRRSRFFPIDSAFTNALRAALGVEGAGACLSTLGAHTPPDEKTDDKKADDE